MTSDRDAETAQHHEAEGPGEPTPDEAAEMLRMMDATRRTTSRSFVRAWVWVLVVWAAAWAIGFGSLWMARGIGGVDLIPTTVAWSIYGVSILAAVAWSIVAGIRSARSGIRGRSQLQGALYGWSWTISMVGAWAVLMGFQRAGLSAELANLVYPAVFILVVGILYLAGGALWRSPVQYALGIVMIAVVAGATLMGAPWHFLIYATVGPVAMLIGAVLLGRGTLPLETRLPGERRAS